MNRLLIALCFLGCSTYGQDTITIRHLRYTTTFDTVLHYPVLVHWIVKASDVCGTHSPHRANRKGIRFTPDPQLESATNIQKYYTHNPGKYQRAQCFDSSSHIL